MENTDGGRVRVKVGSIAFLAAAGTGYGIGLDDLDGDAGEASENGGRECR